MTGKEYYDYVKGGGSLGRDETGAPIKPYPGYEQHKDDDTCSPAASTSRRATASGRTVLTTSPTSSRSSRDSRSGAIATSASGRWLISDDKLEKRSC
jgi:hypothetical protein